MKKRILITGGSGFIGSNLINSLSNSDYTVLSIGRNTREVVKVELCDQVLQQIVQDFSPDIVCHFASGSNIARAAENIEREYKNTVNATSNLISSLKSLGKPPKIVYLSSQAVYGVPEYLPVLENHSCKPTTVYGQNKLKVENIILKSNLSYLIFRVSSVFGKYKGYLESGAIANFINKIKDNQSPVVFNSFDIFSDFLYVNDLTDVLVKIINEDFFPNDIFNLGSSCPTSLKQVLDILYEYFPSAPKPILVENLLYPTKESKGIYLDISKIKTCLKWTPKYSVKDGLMDMLKDLELTRK